MNVKTSRDGVFFDNDASYRYYLHGPLARVEIGDERVQGIDYIYTLQGWIKGVNSNSLIVSTDPGKDGNTFGINKNFARDAFGYSLNYFGGDYQAIDPNKSLSANNFIASTEDFTNLAVDAPSLYNGNISSMVTTITDPAENNVLPQFTMYKYDQLNRLKNMKAFADFDFDKNTWKPDGYDGRYQNDFTYDANGNIEAQLRKDESGNTINDLTYNRYNNAQGLIQNRLYGVFRVLMSNERLVKFGIRTKYTELETKPVSKQSSSQVFGFLIGMNDVLQKIHLPMTLTTREHFTTHRTT
ncbi:MAG: hypothetical protein RBS19_12075 [Bacteroidales bacterium]|nr:hypothetical protein [Bacteroidales bacterium]MDY0217682.1 hypothetical protein [Bacteroidales bacterium]